MKIRSLAVILLTLFFWLSVFGGYIEKTVIMPGKVSLSIFLSIGVVLILLTALLKLRRIKVDGFFYLLVCTLPVLLLSLTAAIDLEMSLRFMLIQIAAILSYVIIYTCCYCLGLQVFRLPALLTLIAVVSSQMWQYAFPDQYHFFAEILLTPSAYLENLNWYLAGRIGGLMIFAVPAALSAVILSSIVISSFSSWKKVPKLVMVIIISIVATSSILSGYRIALIFSCIWSIFIFYAASNKGVFRSTPIIGLLVITVFFSTLELIRQFQDESRILTVIQRVDLWKAGLELFKVHPYTGIGINNFVAYASMAGGFGILNEVTHVHNVFIQVLAETGVVGFTILITCVYICARNNVIYTKILLALKKYEHLPLTGATLAFGIYSLVGNPIHNHPLLLLFVTLQAIVNAELSKTKWGVSHNLDDAKNTNSNGLYPRPQPQRLAGHR